MFDPRTLTHSFSLGDRQDLGSWGHEYVRSLAGEIGQEYNSRMLKESVAGASSPIDDLVDLVKTILPFHLQHNAEATEAEAVDLLIEV